MRLERRGSSSEGFCAVIRHIASDLAERLGCPSDVVLEVYGKLEEVPIAPKGLPLSQSTLVFRDRRLIILVEENWRRRNVRLWRGMLAQALAEVALKPSLEVPRNASALEALAYKVVRMYEVHKFLVDRGVLDAQEEVLQAITWRLRLLVSAGVDSLELLSSESRIAILAGVIVAWPYRQYSKEIREASNALLSVVRLEENEISEPLDAGDTRELYKILLTAAGSQR